MKKADYFEKKNNSVQCQLCPHVCKIKESDVGLCAARINKNNQLYTLTYARTSSKHLDPIEKKPLYHFKPRSLVYSVGSMGCNLACPFCQNWEISQYKNDFDESKLESIVEAMTLKTLPEELVLEAKMLKEQGNMGIAYTYNEPFIWYEYIKECTKKAKENDLANIFVTNGYVLSKPLKDLLPFIDAMNIDLKGFSDDIYKKLGGRLNPVKKTIEKVAKSKCHLEITYLMVPGLNDDLDLFEQLVNWLADTCSEDVPMHISRYFPQYKYNFESTSADLMREANKIASKRLNYVYLGNV